MFFIQFFVFYGYPGQYILPRISPKRIYMRWFYVISFFFIFPAFVSCAGEGPAKQQEGRVLLFYMAVDEASISYDWYDKVEAVVEGAGKAGGNILIYSDTDRGTPTLDEVVASKNGKASLVRLEEFEEENSASGEVLARVIETMVRRYPGRKYGLVMFTHSSGWLPAGTLLHPLSRAGNGSKLSSTRSIGIDDNPAEGSRERTEMELTGFSAALPDGLFDFIIFESCLTANVEVVYELRRKTPYIVASAAEVVSPGFTPLYKTELAGLSDTGSSVDKTLVNFASRYMEHVVTDPAYNYSGTISVVSTSGMDELAESVRAILANTGKDLPDPENIQYFDRYKIYYSPSLPRFFDMEEYAERLAVGKDFDVFREKLDEVVIYKNATVAFLPAYQGFLIRRHCGLTTYIERPEYEEGRINKAWRQTAWYKAIYP